MQNDTRNGILIKLGTAAMTYMAMESHRDLLEARVAEIASFKQAGHDTIFVSSGAVGWGMELARNDRNLHYLIHERQGSNPVLKEKATRTLAGIGQPSLIVMYRELFAKHGITPVQILVNVSDFESSSDHYIPLCAQLCALSKEPHVIPVVNENDLTVIRYEEREDFDNDILAAKIATMNGDIGGNIGHMISISISGGIYTCDPHTHPDEAKLVREIGWGEDRSPANTGGKSESGTGGMAPKIVAACIAARHGINAYVIGPNHSLRETLEGNCAGTSFPAMPQPGKWFARQLHIGKKKYGLS